MPKKYKSKRYHELHETLKIEDVISERTMNDIKDQLDVFIKGMEHKRSKEIDYKVSLGFLVLPCEQVIDSEVVEAIISTIVDYYQTPFNKIVERNRKRTIVEMRQMLHFMMSEFSSLPLEAIGSLTGGYNHTTVLYSIKAVSDDIETNDRMKQHHDDIKEQLNKKIYTYGKHEINKPVKKTS